MLFEPTPTRVSILNDSGKFQGKFSVLVHGMPIAQVLLIHENYPTGNIHILNHEALHNSQGFRFQYKKN